MKTLDSIAKHAALRFDELTAQRDAAFTAARDLLAILKRDGGFRTPVQQSTIRGVRALLVEHGWTEP